MIALVNGIVRAIAAEKVVIEVGGVGLSITTTSAVSNTLHIGAPCQLFTSLIVREDSLTLYGFATDESKKIFELLLSVSGIGPKAALAIVSAHSPETLALAVANEDLKAFEKVPGIGKKGAARLLLELKGKVGDFHGHLDPTSHEAPQREQLLQALISLGYSAKESDSAINSALTSLSQSGVDISTLALSDLLKAALQNGNR